MENGNELVAKILELERTIKEKYPELMKYLDEMTVTIPDETHPRVTNSALADYYLSLKNMLDTYDEETKQKGK